MPATAEKKLFSEIRDFQLTEFEEDVVSERTGRKVSTFSGIHQVAEIENNNGRVYPLALFETLLKDEVFRKKVERRRLVGQMGHPTDGIVNPIDISHVTVEIRIMHDQKQEDGGVPIWAKSEILPTPAGEVLKTLFKSGVQIGTSSRGWGDSFSEDGVEVLDQNFDLGGFDMVVEPSVDTAFPQPNIAESYQRLVKRVQERVDQFDPKPQEVTTEELEAYDAIIESIVCGSAQCDIDDEAVEALKSLRSRVQESLKLEVGVYGGSGPPDEKKKKKKKKRETAEEPSPLATETGETKMPDAATISPELEQQLAAMSATLTEQMEGLKQENESLRKQVEGASRINSELKSKLDAALEMIGRLTERLKGEGKRSEAAKKLAQASIEMSQDLNSKLSTGQNKLSAAEKLVTSSVKRANKVTNESLSEHVAGLVRRFPASRRKAVAHTFDGVKTYQEANTRYRSIQALVGSKRSRTRDDEEVVGALRRKGSRRYVQESREPGSLSTQTGDDIVNRTHALVNKLAEQGAAVNG